MDEHALESIQHSWHDLLTIIATVGSRVKQVRSAVRYLNGVALKSPILTFSVVGARPGWVNLGVLL